MEMIFFRNLPSILILPLLLKNKNIPLRGKNNPLLLLRCFFGFLSTVGYFYTFKTMTMTDAMTIRQLSPFFIIIFATIFLKEKISFQRIPVFLLIFLQIFCSISEPVTRCGRIFLIFDGEKKIDIKLDLSVTLYETPRNFVTFSGNS